MSRFSPTVRAWHPDDYGRMMGALGFAGQRQDSLERQKQTERRTAEVEKSGEAYRKRVEQQIKDAQFQRLMREANFRLTYGAEEDRQAGHEPVPATVRAPLGAQQGGNAPSGMVEQKGATIPQYELGDARNRIALTGGWSIAKPGGSPLEQYAEEQRGTMEGLYGMTGYSPAEASLISRGGKPAPDFYRDMGVSGAGEYEELLRMQGENAPAMFVEQFREGSGREGPRHDSYVRDEGGGASGDPVLNRQYAAAEWSRVYLDNLRLYEGDREAAWRATNDQFREQGYLMDPKGAMAQVEPWAEPDVSMSERGGAFSQDPNISDAEQELIYTYGSAVRAGIPSDEALRGVVSIGQAGGMTPAEVIQMIRRYEQSQRNITYEDLIGGGLLGPLYEDMFRNPSE